MGKAPACKAGHAGSIPAHPSKRHPCHYCLTICYSKAMAPRPKIFTRNGYEYGEVVSALQKCIRRGREREALAFAFELAEPGDEGSQIPGYGNGLWKRLRIICSEDIGPAWPEGPAVIRALYDNWLEASKASKGGTVGDRANSGWPLFIAHAVILLCRAPKSRLNDWACIVAWGEVRAEDGWHPEIPDVALDKHTARGRKMGRGGRPGWDHFFTEGTVLEPLVLQPHEDEYRAEAIEFLVGPEAESEPEPFDQLELGD